VHGQFQSQLQGPAGNLESHTLPHRPYREILLVAVFILFNSLSFLLIQYDRLRTAKEALETWVPLMLGGKLSAPDQYRIAMAYLPHLIELHSGLKPNQSIPLIEFVCYALALTLLYMLFRSSPHVVHGKPPSRIVLLGFFLAALQFPVLWIFPRERPETLPTPFYRAAIVFVIVQRSRLRFVFVCLLATLLSIGQAFMRADVPVAVGAAILLAAVISLPLRRPRSHIVTLGILCIAAGAGVQLYLQHVLFPQATYPPNVPKIQLLANLNPIFPPAHIPFFLTALLPFIVSLLLIRRNHRRIDASDKLVLLICFVYLPIWITVGLVGEVRIFVPFLLLAAPTIAKLWAAFLLNEGPDTSYIHTSPPAS
jgi:hypothetical protein